jgi:hypothetical protein
VPAVTVTAAPPLFPSLVATTFAVPAATAVTSPAPLTDATPGADDVHVTERPVNTLPAESRSVACACAVWPTVREVADSVTFTVATGTGVTVSGSEPLCPSLVAVTVTVPAASAVTTPVGETVATVVLEEVQPTVRPVRTFPDASLSVTLICIVAPTTSDVELTESETVATAAGGGATTARVAAAL